MDEDCSSRKTVISDPGIPQQSKELQSPAFVSSSFRNLNEESMEDDTPTTLVSNNHRDISQPSSSFHYTSGSPTTSRANIQQNACVALCRHLLLAMIVITVTVLFYCTCIHFSGTTKVHIHYYFRDKDSLSLFS